MVGVTISLFAWGLTLLISGSIVWYTGFKYHTYAQNLHTEAKEYVKKIETRTKKEYNYIATMTPYDLHIYLSNMFAIMLELKSVSFVSSKDPEAVKRLYSYSVIGLHEYLGNETVSAINYYYGQDYIIRWAEVQYQLLFNTTGAITDLLEGHTRASNISPLLQNSNIQSKKEKP